MRCLYYEWSRKLHLFRLVFFSVTTLAPSTTHFILDIGAQYGWRRSPTPRTRKFVGFRSFFCMCVMFACVYRHKSFRLTHWYVSMLGDSTSVACRAVRGDGNRRLNWLSNLACSDYPDCLTLLAAMSWLSNHARSIVVTVCLTLFAAIAFLVWHCLAATALIVYLCVAAIALSVWLYWQQLHWLQLMWYRGKDIFYSSTEVCVCVHMVC